MCVCVAAVCESKCCSFRPHFQADPSVSQTGAAHNQLALRRETTLRQACPLECQGAQCAFKDSMLHGSCNSHYVSQFAAFFIDARTKRSVVESFECLCICMFVCNSVLHSLCLCLRPGGPRLKNEANKDSTVCALKGKQGHRQEPPPQAHVLRETRTVLRSGIPTNASPLAPNCQKRHNLSNDPSAGSPTETLLRLLVPLNDQV